MLWGVRLQYTKAAFMTRIKQELVPQQRIIIAHCSQNYPALPHNLHGSSNSAKNPAKTPEQTALMQAFAAYILNSEAKLA